MTSIWDTLGLTPDSGEREIKRAYAKRLKQTRPEEDPQGFQELRLAYETALQLSRRGLTQALTTIAETETGEAEVAAPQLSATQRPDAVALTAIPPQNIFADDMTPAAHSAVPAGAPPAPDGAGPDNPAPGELPVAEQAARLWHGFLTDQPPGIVRLRALLDSDALLNLDLRDAFEMCACVWSAEETADPALVSILVQTFQWDQGVGHLLHMNQHLPHIVMGRYHAERAWHQLQQDACERPALRLLLSGKMPPWPFQLLDQAFVREMQGWIHTIRWKLPEVLQYKMDLAAFEMWSRRLDERRYFFQTAVTSFFLGLPLTLLILSLFTGMGWIGPVSNEPRYLWWMFFCGEAGSFALVTWLTLRPSSALMRWFTHMRDEVLQRQINVTRFDKRLHFLAIGLFGLISVTLIFEKTSTLLQGLQFAGLLISVAFLAYTTSANLSRVEMGVSLTLGLINALIQYKPGLFSFSFGTACLFLSALFLLLIQGSRGMMRWYSVAAINKIRLILICSMLLLMLLNYLQIIPHDQPLYRSFSVMLLLWFLSLIALQTSDLTMKAPNLMIPPLRGLFILALVIVFMPDGMKGLPGFLFTLNTSMLLLLATNVALS